MLLVLAVCNYYQVCYPLFRKLPERIRNILFRALHLAATTGIFLSNSDNTSNRNKNTQTTKQVINACGVVRRRFISARPTTRYTCQKGAQTRMVMVYVAYEATH